MLSGLMLIAGGLFTAITINLFEVLKVNIITIYFNYFVAIGVSIIPLFAAYLIENNGHLVHKVSPVIARIFTPLVTITLLILIRSIIKISLSNLFLNRMLFHRNMCYMVMS